MSDDPLGALVPGWEPRLAASGADGPLAGLRVVVKDVIDVAGSVTGAGNPDWSAAHEPAQKSAAAVTALTDAGASVAGKGQCAELAFSLSGDNVHLGMPTTGTPAPGRRAGGERERARVSAGQLTSIATLAGAPAISMPLLEVGGPVGLSLVGAPDSDLSLLAAL